MKDNHENIDERFRNALGQHRTPPPEWVWYGIEVRRQSAKPSLWRKWRLPGAFGLVAAFTALLWWQLGTVPQEQHAEGLASTESVTAIDAPAASGNGPQVQQHAPSAITGQDDPSSVTASSAVSGSSPVASGSQRSSAASLRASNQSQSGLFGAQEHIERQMSQSSSSYDRNGQVINNLLEREVLEAPQIARTPLALVEGRPVLSVENTTAAMGEEDAATLATPKHPKAGGAASGRFTASLLSGPVKALPTWGTTAPDMQNYVSTLQAAHLPVSVNARLSLGYNVAGHWRVLSGLQYTKVDEHIAYDIYRQDMRVDTNIHGQVMTAFAQPRMVKSIDTSFVTSKETIRADNSYTFIDIPLLLAYYQPMGRGGIQIEAGPMFNLRTMRKGYTLDPVTRQPVAIAADAKTQMGIQAHIGMRYTYPVSQHLSLTGGPYLQYSLKSQQPYQDVSQRMHRAGVQAGVEVNW